MLTKIKVLKHGSSLIYLIRVRRMFFNDVHTRIRFVFLVILAILIAIVIRVFYIQVFQYDKLNQLAESLWSRELPITADRGEILDRNGKVLATNVTTTSLVIIPNQIVHAEEVAKALSDILQSDYEEFIDQFYKYRKKMFGYEKSKNHYFIYLFGLRLVVKRRFLCQK